MKNLLHQKGRTRQECLLLILGTSPDTAMRVAKICEIGRANGLRKIASWNVSQYLAGMKQQAVQTGSGWELTKAGLGRAAELAGKREPRLEDTAHSLREHATKLTSVDARSYVEEAILCFEFKAFRAAVVFLWAGAISVLQEHVVSQHLAAFNAEAARRTANQPPQRQWRPATTKDDLARMKEHDFLEVLHGIKVLEKNIKQILQNELLLRNSCGHPTSVKIDANSVASMIEKLILNVFARF